MLSVKHNDGCAYESNKPAALCVIARVQTQLLTCLQIRGSVCVSRSHKFTQLGNYILQMAASRGERANVTGGKYYCSADLRLKVLRVSVFWESCSPDLARHDQPHQRLQPLGLHSHILTEK